jgi:hypothetical protein
VVSLRVTLPETVVLASAMSSSRAKDTPTTKVAEMEALIVVDLRMVAVTFPPGPSIDSGGDSSSEVTVWCRAGDDNV